MSNLTDLDVLLPEPKRVTLAGREYLLPADIPIPLVLRIEQLAGTEVTDTVIVELYNDALALFQVHQPDLKELPISAVQLLQLIPVVYYGAKPAGDADPPRKPKAKRAAGTRSTSRPKTTRSRSRS
jgi:hypothetical protein